MMVNSKDSNLLLLISKDDMGEIFKKPARIRKASQKGKAVSVPPETEFKPGDEVIQYYNGFMLIVPKGVTVDEELLKQAIKLE